MTWRRDHDDGIAISQCRCEITHDHANQPVVFVVELNDVVPRPQAHRANRRSSAPFPGQPRSDCIRRSSTQATTLYDQRHAGAPDRSTTPDTRQRARFPSAATPRQFHWFLCARPAPAERTDSAKKWRGCGSTSRVVGRGSTRAECRFWRPGFPRIGASSRAPPLRFRTSRETGYLRPLTTGVNGAGLTAVCVSHWDAGLAEVVPDGTGIDSELCSDLGE